MLDRYVWYVIQREENGKFCVYAERIRMNNNLAAFVKDTKGIVTMNACESKKVAEEIADDWNARFKEKGNYLYA